MAQVDSESTTAARACPTGISSAVVIGRRGFLARAAAALAGASVATPVAITTALAASEEHPALVAAGQRLDGLVEAFRVATARRWEARDRARALLPEVPEEIVSNDHRWDDCAYEQRDVDDKPLSTGVVTDADGKTWPARPNKIIDSTALKRLVKDGEVYCDGRTRLGKKVKRMIALAERYEADREAAIERSGLYEANEAVFRASDAIDKLAREVAIIEPKTQAGAVVLARVLLAYVATEDDHNRRHGVQVLGKPLAEAVARLA